MSLTSFIQMPEVRDRLREFRPPPPRKIGVPVLVPLRHRRYMLVGTAFDYLLRFELQRQSRKINLKPWVAEAAPNLVCPPMTATGRIVWDVFAGACPSEYLPPELVVEKINAILKRAKLDVAKYATTKSPATSQKAALARHALKLAKLDSVYRAHELERGFEDAEPELVQELLELLAIVPISKLAHKKVMHLNPTFGASSELVGGADADLITGETLVDFKTTNSNAMQAPDLDQLFGYFLLARHHRGSNRKFPVIRKVGFYFCRHGHLWTLDTSFWTNNSQLPMLEKWFFQWANDLRERARINLEMMVKAAATRIAIRKDAHSPKRLPKPKPKARIRHPNP